MALAGESVADPLPFQYPACVIPFLTAYLNRADVRAALHVTAPTSYAWMGCAQQIVFSSTDAATSMLPIYGQLQAQPAVPILIFSGDVDGYGPRLFTDMPTPSLPVLDLFGGLVACLRSIVPYLGTRNWTTAMGLPVHRPFAAWFEDDTSSPPQIGGWATTFATAVAAHGGGRSVAGSEPWLTVTSVRGAGHMVGTSQPQRLLRLMSSWLVNGSIPGGK